MPLQNRVDPFGRLIRTPARGGWTGNRGVLHDPNREIVRPFRLKAWLICRLEFKGRHREVMTPGRWTELFFLDEATALSAGHRPCAECRRADYLSFKAAAEAGTGRAFPRAADLDAALHADRWSAGDKATFAASPATLPDGAMMERDGEPWLKWRGRLHRWAPQGSTDTTVVSDQPVRVLTPRTTVAALEAGYRPQVSLADGVAL